MKTVFMFKRGETLSAADMEARRADLKKQISEGVLVLDGGTDFLGAIPADETLAAVEAAEPLAVAEKPSGAVVTVTRWVRDKLSLAELKAAITSGRGLDVIRPFDEFDVMLDTGELVTVVCGGYISKTRARFIFKDCLKEPGVMNDDATNEGGYYKSKGRKHVLEDIYPHLPPELREIIEPRTIAEEIDGETVEYSDPLWLPAATDFFGSSEYWAPEPDSVQLDIFEHERDRVKEREGYGTCGVWLRSPRASNSYNFVFVYTDGTVYYAYASYSLGFAPGFDL